MIFQREGNHTVSKSGYSSEWDVVSAASCGGFTSTKNPIHLATLLLTFGQTQLNVMAMERKLKGGAN